MANGGLISGRVALEPSSLVPPKCNGKAGAEATRPRLIVRSVSEVIS